ncbi:MAG: SDR family oxidoreductase [Cyanobacteria bacterium SID2]|nr:SDR family oxidoreductase [Cyanobacteria bacterium SID2]MBP0005961.1 SDR family oxidoreductase [Cyanobacteria bacterium SBC]
MTNVAILGCGYVGVAVSRHWKQQGLTVTATTTRPERLPELDVVAQRTVIVRGDDPKALIDLLQGQDTLLVSVSTKRTQPYEVAYLETARTLVSVLDTAPTLNQIIYTSSCSVYGDRGGDWVDEATPVRPNLPHYEVLAGTEAVLLDAATETRRVCVLRLGGIYGPGREIAKIYSRMAGTTRPGTGSKPSNWVHIDDIVGAIDFARTQRLSGIYNVVDDDVQPTRDLIQKVCEKYRLAPVSWDAQQSVSPSYSAKISNAKLKNAGYQFRHPQRMV